MAPPYERLSQDGDEDLIVHGPDAIIGNGSHTPGGSRATFHPQPNGHGEGQEYRPVTYYGEGPFDPPSSDEEDGALLEKDLQKLWKQDIR